MDSKIKNLHNQTDTILNNDFLILDRNTIPFRVSGKTFKEFISAITSSSARYCRDDGEACETKGEVYDLGKKIITALDLNTLTLDITSGIPIRIYSNGTSSDEGWMYYENGTPNKIKISFKNNVLDFEEGDSTALSDGIMLETVFGIFTQIDDIPFRLSIEGEI